MRVFDKDFPIKVKFKQTIFEDEFVESGMIAYLTKVEIDENASDVEEEKVYCLWFNQEPFASYNEILLTDCYYPNIHTVDLPKKQYYTAKEAGMFKMRWTSYLSVFEGQSFESVASEYLELIV